MAEGLGVGVFCSWIVSMVLVGVNLAGEVGEGVGLVGAAWRVHPPIRSETNRMILKMRNGFF